MRVPDATVVIDGAEGTVIIDPTPETVAAIRGPARRADARAALSGRLRRLPAVTRDGVEITLEANLELPVELEQAVANGAMGLGLVRSEFLYMNRDDLPDEDEQYAVFSALVRGMEGKPVTVRTFDLGGEKLARSLADHYAAGRQPGARACARSGCRCRIADCSTRSSRRCCAPPPRGRCASCCR